MIIVILGIYSSLRILKGGNSRARIINGFQKKTQRIPKKEIKKAKSIMKEYFDNKTK